MTAAMIAQLILQLGPAALNLIQDLTAVWSKPALTLEEVITITSKAQKSYDQYIADAKSVLTP